MKYYYPAIFTPAEEGFTLTIPDADCTATGADIADCMQNAQEAITAALATRNHYPSPSDLTAIDISAMPIGTFVSYVCFDATLSERQLIEHADNPIRELLNRRHLKISQLAEMLGAPYRTIQDQAAGNSKPPKWVVKLILDKILNN